MDTDGVRAWVTAYERAWRASDPDAVAELFTPDARYRKSPYEPDEVGHEAIRAFWAEDEGLPFTMTADVVAVQEDRAAVRLEVHYTEVDPREYRDVWLLRFAPDGRCADFEEWAYWPGRPYTSEGG